MKGGAADDTGDVATPDFRQMLGRHADLASWREMPTLVIVRDHPKDIAHRYAIMSLDGEQVARLKFKERFEAEISPGRHSLQGKNELGKASTVEFDAKEGETVTVHIGGIPIGCMSWFAGVVPPTPSIVMKVNEGWGVGHGANWKE